MITIALFKSHNGLSGRCGRRLAGNINASKSAGFRYHSTIRKNTRPHEIVHGLYLMFDCTFSYIQETEYMRSLVRVA